VASTIVVIINQRVSTISGPPGTRKTRNLQTKPVDSTRLLLPPPFEKIRRKAMDEKDKAVLNVKSGCLPGAYTPEKIRAALHKTAKREIPKAVAFLKGKSSKQS